MFSRFVLFLLLGVFIGCAGGTKTDTKIPGIEKVNKINITEKNIQKLTQAIHYLEELDFDLDTSIEYSSESRKVDNHLSSTGKGYVVFTYVDYKDYKESIFNGTIRLEKQSDNKIKALYDLRITTEDNNISLYVSIDSKDDSLVVHKYKIYDQKNKETIEVKEGKISKNGSHGKLYIGSEGYVSFDNTEKVYKLKGSDSIATISYPQEYGIKSPIIEVTIDNIHKSDLYYKGYQVTKYDPPRFEDIIDADGFKVSYMQKYFKDIIVRYQLANRGIDETTVDTEWYVNGIKVDTLNKYELPNSMYKEGDKIEVVLIGKHGDVWQKKRITIDDSSLISEYIYFSKKVELEYHTNTLEFALDLSSYPEFSHIDISKSLFSWHYDENTYPFEPDMTFIEESEKYQMIPHIKIKEFGFQHEPLYLTIYHNHKKETIKIQLMIKTDYFSYTRYQMQKNVGYLPYFDIKDFNSDNLKDIMFCTNEFYEGLKCNLIVQRENNIFEDDGDYYRHTANMTEINGGVESEVIKVYAMEDMDHDGQVDIFMSVGSDFFIQRKKNKLWIQTQILNNYLGLYDGSIVTIEDLDDDGLEDFIIKYHDNLNDGSRVQHTFIGYQNLDGSYTELQVKDALHGVVEYDLDNVDTRGLLIDNEFFRLKNRRLEKSATINLSEYFNESQKYIVGDFNNDDREDIAYLTATNKFIILYRNNIGSFDVSTHAFNFEEFDRIVKIISSDVNGDGLDDIVIVNDFLEKDDSVDIYFNRVSGIDMESKIEYPFGNQNYSKLWQLGDIDGDKFQEFIFDTAIGIFKEDSFLIKPTYLTSSYFLGFSKTIDINDDGRDDIVKINHRGLLEIALSKR